MLISRRMRVRAHRIAMGVILAAGLTVVPITASALSASAVSAADTLDSRPPVIVVDYPLGGETFVGTANETLQWSIDEQSWDGAATPVTLRLLDGNALLDEITIQPDPGGVYAYVWTVSDLTTAEGRLVVSAADRFGWSSDDSSGVFTILDSGTATPDLLVDRLGPAVPNPFNPSTRFNLRADAVIELSVYDMKGREIARLAEGDWDAGRHDIQWLGRDKNGAPVASGAYFARLHIRDADDLVTRLTLVR